ncbi:NUMOD4 motif-containing HNH endonuclease [Brevundimonas naejangsanensis]
MTEIWKPVVGHEGAYEVSDQGRVRSVPHERVQRDGKPRRVKGCVLKLQTRDPRYYSVSIGGRSIRVHQLVAEAFLGPAPDGCIVLHANDNGHQNHVDNLRWGTHSINRADARHNRGAAGALARSDGRLTEADASVIKALIVFMPRRVVARAFGVSRGCVDGIHRGKNWRDTVPCGPEVARRELERRRA